MGVLLSERDEVGILGRDLFERDHLACGGRGGETGQNQERRCDAHGADLLLGALPPPGLCEFWGVIDLTTRHSCDADHNCAVAERSCARASRSRAQKTRPARITSPRTASARSASHSYCRTARSPPHPQLLQGAEEEPRPPGRA